MRSGKLTSLRSADDTCKEVVKITVAFSFSASVFLAVFFFTSASMLDQTFTVNALVVFLPMENTACVKAFVVWFVIGISFVASLVFCVDSIHPGSVFMFIRENPRVSVCEPSDALMSHCVLDETLLLFR